MARCSSPAAANTQPRSQERELGEKDHISTQSLHSADLVSQLPTPRKSEVFYRIVALPAPQIYKAGRTSMDHGIQQCSCFSHPASIEGRDASHPVFLERLPSSHAAKY